MWKNCCSFSTFVEESTFGGPEDGNVLTSQSIRQDSLQQLHLHTLVFLPRSSTAAAAADSAR